MKGGHYNRRVEWPLPGEELVAVEDDQRTSGERDEDGRAEGRNPETQSSLDQHIEDRNTKAHKSQDQQPVAWGAIPTWETNDGWEQTEGWAKTESPDVPGRNESRLQQSGAQEIEGRATSMPQVAIQDTDAHDGQNVQSAHDTQDVQDARDCNDAPDAQSFLRTGTYRVFICERPLGIKLSDAAHLLKPIHWRDIRTRLLGFQCMLANLEPPSGAQSSSAESSETVCISRSADATLNVVPGARFMHMALFPENITVDIDGKNTITNWGNAGFYDWGLACGCHHTVMLERHNDALARKDNVMARFYKVWRMLYDLGDASVMDDAQEFLQEEPLFTCLLLQPIYWRRIRRRESSPWQFPPPATYNLVPPSPTSPRSCQPLPSP